MIWRKTPFFIFWAWFFSADLTRVFIPNNAWRDKKWDVSFIKLCRFIVNNKKKPQRNWFQNQLKLSGLTATSEYYNFNKTN